MKPYQINPHSSYVNIHNMNTHPLSTHVSLPGSPQPLNKASCNWLDSMHPSNLGALIKRTLINSPQSLTLLNSGQSKTYSLKLIENQNTREVRLSLGVHAQDLSLDAVQLAPDQVLSKNGPIVPSINASGQAKLWFMDQQILLSRNNSLIDSHKLTEQFHGAAQLLPQIDLINQHGSNLVTERTSLSNNLKFARTSSERHNMDDRLKQISKDLTNLQAQKNNLEHRFSVFQKRFDFVSRGTPPMKIYKGANNPYKTEIKAFLKDLYENDRDSFRKRFDDMKPRDVDLSNYDNILLVFHGNKVIGMADCTLDEEMTPKTATINSVVHGDYQRLNVGKILTENRDQVLLREGFSYKSGGIYHNNAAQINRLQRNGWHETANSVREKGEMRYFWKALDPRLENRPPRER